MKGLGKAVVLEAVKRCGQMGAKTALVGSSQQFYYNIGFYPIHTSVVNPQKLGTQGLQFFEACIIRLLEVYYAVR